jgi:hypothetical protein
MKAFAMETQKFVLVGIVARFGVVNNTDILISSCKMRDNFVQF